MRAVVFMMALLLGGCGAQHRVLEPLRNPAAAPQAEPKYEPRTIAGNKNPYTILGKTYELLPSALGYKQRGVASWYGQQFHGRATSNGERFDMYAVSAAHKTLPIPSYVKVTNLVNHKTLLVRVNDRGPFVDDRIIDLSYAAALQLGFATQGTTEVLLEAIEFHPDGTVMQLPKPPLNEAEPPHTAKPTPAPPIVTPQKTEFEAVAVTAEEKSVVTLNTDQNLERYVQVGRYQTEASARSMALKLDENFDEPIVVHRSAADFLVAIGPLLDNLAVDKVKALLGLQGIDDAFTINQIR